MVGTRSIGSPIKNESSSNPKTCRRRGHETPNKTLSLDRPAAKKYPPVPYDSPPPSFQHGRDPFHPGPQSKTKASQIQRIVEDEVTRLKYQTLSSQRTVNTSGNDFL